MNHPPHPDAVLTADEVAEWLRIRPRAVQRLGIPAVKLGHRTIVYRAGAVLAWLKSKETSNAEA